MFTRKRVGWECFLAGLPAELFSGAAEPDMSAPCVWPLPALPRGLRMFPAHYCIVWSVVGSVEWRDALTGCPDAAPPPVLQGQGRGQGPVPRVRAPRVSPRAPCVLSCTRPRPPPRRRAYEGIAGLGFSHTEAARLALPVLTGMAADDAIAIALSLMAART